MSVFNVPIPKPAKYQGHDPSPGMRISTDCPTRRYLEWRDPSKYASFPENIGNWGYTCAAAFIDGFFSDTRHQIEVPIDWPHGTTSVDLQVLDGPYAGQWEIKSTSMPIEKFVSSSAYTQAVRQVARQQWCARGDDAFAETGDWHIAVVCKSGKDQGFARGPFPVHVMDECRDGLCRACWSCLDAEFAQLDEWVAGHAIAKELATHLCVCSQCFPKQRVPFPRTVRDDAQKLAYAKQMVSSAKAELAEIDATAALAGEVKASLKKWEGELKTLRAEVAGSIDDKTATYVDEDMGVEMTFTKKGVAVVREVASA